MRNPTTPDLEAIKARQQNHSPHRFMEFFRTYQGPTLKALEALDEAGKESLVKGIEALAAQFNRSSNGTLTIPSEYLEGVTIRS